MLPHYIEVHMKNGEVYYYYTTIVQNYAHIVRRFFEGTFKETNSLLKTNDGNLDYVQVFYNMSDVSHLVTKDVYVDDDGQGGYVAVLD